MANHNIDLGGVEHKVLLQVKAGPVSTLDLHTTLQPTMSPADLASTVCNQLQAEDVLDYWDGKWMLGANGQALLNFLEFKAKNQTEATPTVAALRTYKPPSHHYVGDELKVTSPRAGAYDFLAKPSRMGDALVPHPTAHLANT